MTKWDHFSAHNTVREIIASDPELLSSVVSGMAAGHAAALTKLKEEMAWSNLAMDAALMLATKRATPGAAKLLERSIVKRLELFGGGLNEIEREFLAEHAPAVSP